MATILGILSQDVPLLELLTFAMESACCCKPAQNGKKLCAVPTSLSLIAPASADPRLSPSSPQL